MIKVAAFYLYGMSLRPLFTKMHTKQTELSENKIFQKLGSNSNTENCLGESLNSHFVSLIMNLHNNIVFWMNLSFLSFVWFKNDFPNWMSTLIRRWCYEINLFNNCLDYIANETPNYTSTIWMINKPWLDFKQGNVGTSQL